MAIARKHIVNQEQAGFYHCTNRCVRRAFLCGFDELTGRSFDHRKQWLEQRMMELCQIFSIDLFGYAVMDNHYHLVVYVDPKAPLDWSDEEVAERWLKAFPGRLSANNQLWKIKRNAIISNKEKLNQYRNRLGSLSWFMRCLNEPLAKMSNMEDCCTGKFWEGRFYSQALLDEAALISCMAYVDLNPIRAQKAVSISDSHHTSIKTRIEKHSAQVEAASELNSISGNAFTQKLSIQLREYVNLIEWTAKHIHFPNHLNTPEAVNQTIDSLNLKSANWLEHIASYGSHFYYFVGATQKLRAKAAELKKRCLHGIKAARFSYQ